jgi:hypothetical protein
LTLFLSTFVLGQKSLPFSAFQDSIIIHDPNPYKDISIKLYRGYLGSGTILHADTVIGKYSNAPAKTVFKPLLPLSKSIQYTLALDKELYYFDLGIPDNYQYLKVVQVYPILVEWPQNISKFHIEFNKPVQDISLTNQISLESSSEKENNQVSLEIKRDTFPNSDHFATFSLIQKTLSDGTMPLQSQLEAGIKYLLTIHPLVKDVDGVPMQKIYKQEIKVGKVDLISPQPTSWKFTLPLVNSTQPFIILLDEYLDYRNAKTSLGIKNDTHHIAGRWKYSMKTNQIEFYPNLPWISGDYVLEIDKKIEDVSGNNLIKKGTEISDSNQFLIPFKLK